MAEQPYHYLTVDEMKTLGDDSLPIDVTRDEHHADNRDISGNQVINVVFNGVVIHEVRAVTTWC